MPYFVTAVVVVVGFIVGAVVAVVVLAVVVGSVVVAVIGVVVVGSVVVAVLPPLQAVTVTVATQITARNRYKNFRFINSVSFFIPHLPVETLQSSVSPSNSP
jgi:hypothetical protein